MKKFLALMLVLTMAVSLAACGSSKPAEEAEPAAEAEEAAEEGEEDWGEAPEVSEAPPCERIIIWNSAIEELESSEQPRGDDMRVSYSIKDVIDKCEITETAPVQIIGSDGYTAEESYDEIIQKYLTLEGESAPIVVGEAQDPDWAVWEVAYVRIGSDVIMTSYTEDIPFTQVFEDLGMAEADSYDFICTDGYTCNIPADEIDQCSLRQIEGRADGIVPGVGDDSLWSLLYVQPGK